MIPSDLSPVLDVQLPPVLHRLVFKNEDAVLIDPMAFEALEAAWNLYRGGATGDRVVTIRTLSGGTVTFPVSDIHYITVTTAEQRWNAAQIEYLFAREQKALADRYPNPFDEDDKEP